jgi:serine/threonine-protein kinase HipA
MDDDRRRSGFHLSPDLTHDKKAHAPLTDMLAPGAVEDAMPDRWGERLMSVVSRQSCMSPLDKLWYAGAIAVSVRLECLPASTSTDPSTSIRS